MLANFYSNLNVPEQCFDVVFRCQLIGLYPPTNSFTAEYGMVHPDMQWSCLALKGFSSRQQDRPY